MPYEQIYQRAHYLALEASVRTRRAVAVTAQYTLRGERRILLGSSAVGSLDLTCVAA